MHDRRGRQQERGLRPQGGRAVAGAATGPRRCPSRPASSSSPTQIKTFTGGVATGCGSASADVGPVLLPDRPDRSTSTRRSSRTSSRGSSAARAATSWSPTSSPTSTATTSRTCSAPWARSAPSRARPATRSGSSSRPTATPACGREARPAPPTPSGVQIFESIDEGDITEALDAAKAVGDDRIQQKAGGDVNPEQLDARLLGGADARGSPPATSAHRSSVRHLRRRRQPLTAVSRRSASICGNCRCSDAEVRRDARVAELPGQRALAVGDAGQRPLGAAERGVDGASPGPRARPASRVARPCGQRRAGRRRAAARTPRGRRAVVAEVGADRAAAQVRPVDRDARRRPSRPGRFAGGRVAVLGDLRQRVELVEQARRGAARGGRRRRRRWSGRASASRRGARPGAIRSRSWSRASHGVVAEVGAGEPAQRTRRRTARCWRRPRPSPGPG